jgi:hypothetical protein
MTETATPSEEQAEPQERQADIQAAQGCPLIIDVSAIAYLSQQTCIEADLANIRAAQILSQERAKPRDIAWALNHLIEKDRGIKLQHGEARSRGMLDLHRWILGLDLPTTDALGRPTTPRRGVPVSGSDIEDPMHVRVEEVRRAAAAQALPWPKDAAQDTPPPKAEDSPSRETADPKLARQEAAILQILVNLEFDPLDLPEREPGKAGAKSKAREEALKRLDLFTDSSFEKAWGRLRKDGRLRGAE